MHFEHLIAINDFDRADTTQVSHDQLWRGLVLRAEAPDLFMEGIEQVDIVDRSEFALEREIQLGNMRVRDTIRFDKLLAVHYQTAAGENHGGGTLSMRIESAGDSQKLAVRFIYDTSLADTGDSEDARLSGYVKSAYRQMDIDTIQRIRDMVAHGDLGE